MFINNQIESLPKTSPLTFKKLKSLDINTYFDLLNYFPFRYEDYSLISPISKLQEGDTVTIKGKIESIKNEYRRRGLTIQRAIIIDETGKIEITWFNQPFLIKLLALETLVSISGKVKKFLNKYSLEPEGYEILKSMDQKLVHTACIIPIYHEKHGLSSKLLREKINYIIENIDSISEHLPTEIIQFNNLANILQAYKNIHFPKSINLAQNAHERLSFDELFVIQLSALIIKREWEKETIGNAFGVETQNFASLHKFISGLPFSLTNAQKRSLDEIFSDLKKTTPMNRFLQGDVGSGKTVVAAISAFLSHLNGFQTLIMAPTEILAQQHFNTLTKFLSPYGIKVGIKTGSSKYHVASIKYKKQKNKNIHNTKYLIHDTNVIVGTHALLNENLDFNKVGLVIIDEQHRFGVRQRAMLKKKGINPHLLTMTATPIPRTVILTLYGELDLSVIDEMPKGRLQIKTFLVPKVKRNNGYEWIKNQIKKNGIQVFIVCPLIEESETETMQSIKAVTREYEFLKNDIFNDLKVGLLHGKMKSVEKNRIMQDLKNKKLDILVSTSVVEVGIDIPNATIMVIEGADRFGLAQLHQLRGRVGRSDKQSYCLLFTETANEKTLKKLNFFSKNTNGMSLAEYDLKLRGSGDLYGTKQHGFINLKIASLSDFSLIQKTKNAAKYFLQKYENFDKFKELQGKIEAYRENLISRD